MAITLYKVLVDSKVYARDMDLNTALTLTEALFNKWHSEDNLAITIQRQSDADVICEVVCEEAIEVDH